MELHDAHLLKEIYGASIREGSDGVKLEIMYVFGCEHAQLASMHDMVG